jgi:uncharacterized repeat protein (TIGR03803 family)
MRNSRRCSLLVFGLLSLTLFGIAVYQPAFAANESVLWDFGNGFDGNGPVVLLIDPSGNLFGATSGGGSFGAPCLLHAGCGSGGTVFELAPPATAGGSWSEVVLWNFGDGTDGALPSSVIRDSGGNLYGTTSIGGSFDGGTVFKLTPPPATGGNWPETILWKFGNGNDGSAPDSLIMDSSGNLFGTTSSGGRFRTTYATGGGTVFELVPPASMTGKWTEAILWNFGNGADGALPGRLIRDAGGRLYGTARLGGDSSDGIVFRLNPPSKTVAHWLETVLWNFKGGTDGAGPVGLVMDGHGNLFGTTDAGGSSAAGTAFKLIAPASLPGSWRKALLWNFGGAGDGISPSGTLTRDRRGNLYGTTFTGGSFYNSFNGTGGSAFELSPPAAPGGNWQETLLWSFNNGTDGTYPDSGVFVDPHGNLYGTTLGGGTHGLDYTGGIVFQLNGVSGAGPAQ